MTSSVSEVEARFSKLRRSLDDGGYLESFGSDSLRLVEHLYNDLVGTTDSLQKTLVEYAHYKKIAEELEDGVLPFKEENVRLSKENSQLRIGIARAFEDAEDKARDPLFRLRELEDENNDLKLLVSQFAERVKKAEVESLEKTNRIIKLQEKNLAPNILTTDERGKKAMTQRQTMEIDYFVPEACPQCIRLRNFVEYGKNSDRNPKTVDYIKLSDSRIEALQLQLRSLKNMEKEHMTLIASLKDRVDTRDSEIEKLRDLIKVRAGGDSIRNGKGAKNCEIELKSAEMKLQILQMRNIELEKKMKKSIFEEHESYMLGQIPSQFGERNLASIFLDKELDKYPSHDKMTLLEKLYYLEQQLSHCCKEKAILQRKLEEFRLQQSSKVVYLEKDAKLKAPSTFHSNIEHIAAIPNKKTMKDKSQSETQVSKDQQLTKKSRLSHVVSVHKNRKNPSENQDGVQTTLSNKSEFRKNVGFRSGSSITRHETEETLRENSNDPVVPENELDIGSSEEEESEFEEMGRDPVDNGNQGTVAHQQKAGKGAKGSANVQFTRTSKAKPPFKQTVATGKDEVEQESSTAKANIKNIRKYSPSDTPLVSSGSKEKFKTRKYSPISEERYRTKTTEIGTDEFEIDDYSSVDDTSSDEDIKANRSLETYDNDDDKFQDTDTTTQKSAVKLNRVTSKTSEQPRQTAKSRTSQQKVDSTEEINQLKASKEQQLAVKSRLSHVVPAHNSRKKLTEDQDGFQTPLSNQSEFRKNVGFTSGSSKTRHEAKLRESSKEPKRRLGVVPEQESEPEFGSPNEEMEESDFDEAGGDQVDNGLTVNNDNQVTVIHQRKSGKDGKGSMNIKFTRTSKAKAPFKQTLDTGKDEVEQKSSTAKANMKKISKYSPSDTPLVSSGSKEKFKTQKYGRTSEERHKGMNLDTDEIVGIDDYSSVEYMSSDEDVNANESLETYDNDDKFQDTTAQKSSVKLNRVTLKTSEQPRQTAKSRTSLQKVGSTEEDSQLKVSKRNDLPKTSIRNEYGQEYGRGRSSDGGNEATSQRQTTKAMRDMPVHPMSGKSNSQLSQDISTFEDGRSSGFNTRSGADGSRRFGLPSEDKMDVLQEKKQHSETDDTLQRKIEKLQAKSSRHQPKAFELQRDPERTKHMPQIKNQERETDDYSSVDYKSGDDDANKYLETFGNDDMYQDRTAAQKPSIKPNRVTLKTSEQPSQTAKYRTSLQKVDSVEEASQLKNGKQNDFPKTSIRNEYGQEYGRGRNSGGGDDATIYGAASDSSQSRRVIKDIPIFPMSRKSNSQLSHDIPSFEDSRSSGFNTRSGFAEKGFSSRSIGVNTEGSHQFGLPWESRMDDSQEKKQLLDKVVNLQRKMEELQAESSRHQLKTFELQGELERTKHMLQMEKQDRELATSELRRVQDRNSETSARLLMNSSLGSDTLRKGATPMEMEREVANLRAALSTLDRDNDEMRVELDRKDEKLSRILQDSSQYMDEISQLKLRLKNADLQISHTGESAKEQIREGEFLKKQLENNRRDLEKIIRERDEALKELHKISGAHAKGQMERRSVESELESKSKEADDLRKQVQRYIDEVRRIEELLLDKEEEMEMLIQHYRALTVENGNLEEQRTNLEKEASSIRDSVKDAVDQNIGFKTQLASQNALVQSLEEEIQRFTQQISQLQNQLGSKTEKEEMLLQEAKASKDLLYRLEVQMDKLKLDLADSDSKRKQLEVENAELAAHIASLETRLHDETDRQQQLETLVANSRDKDFQNERTALNISRERDDLAEKLTSLQQRSEALNGEVSRYRLKSIELQSELDRTRRQLDGEKRDRESAISELKRAREQLHSSSANYLLKSALGSSGLQSEGSQQQSPGSGSALRQNLLGAEGLQRSSREQSPFMAPHAASDLQMDTPPNATSTSRYEEKPDYSSNAPGTRSSNNPPDTTQDNDGFENWDSPN